MDGWNDEQIQQLTRCIETSVSENLKIKDMRAGVNDLIKYTAEKCDIDAKVIRDAIKVAMSDDPDAITEHQQAVQDVVDAVKKV